MMQPTNEIPVAARVALNLIAYIHGAAGGPEMRQAITIMREADPIAAAACEQMYRGYLTGV